MKLGSCHWLIIAESQLECAESSFEPPMGELQTTHHDIEMSRGMVGEIKSFCQLAEGKISSVSLS